MRLKSYQRAWLEGHPDRTEEWLILLLCDGFHVHHLDGNHDNDDPNNLVLVEGSDHLTRLHSALRHIPLTSENARRLALKRAAALPGKRRKAIARKAARIRWRKARELRSELRVQVRCP